MGWASWCVPDQSAEGEFTRELMLRSLREMSDVELLATAEHLALQLHDFQLIVSQAAKRIAELEVSAALSAAKPVGEPCAAHRSCARQLLRSLGKG